ncbi:MAG: flagellar basal body-associated FliL family protein [Vicinamibacterales bacterium]
MSDAKAAPAAKKGGRSKMMIVVAAGLILGGGGGFFYWKQTQAAAMEESDGGPKHGSEQSTKKSKHQEVEATGIVPMDAFLVNLADTNASRFVRVTLRLVVETPDEAKEIEESPVKLARARSAILEILATQESAKLVTPEGKDELKKAIAEATTKVLGLEVHDVLFTDFVVQF